MEEHNSSSDSKLFMNSESPRLCGGPSFLFQIDNMGSSSSGCLGISFCKRSHNGSGTSPNNNSNNNNTHSAAKDDNDPTLLIAKAMGNLTLQEQEQAYKDMHSVSAMVQEAPALIDQALHEMELCLQKTDYKPAYNLAMSI
jgi:hypothetical protein